MTQQQPPSGAATAVRDRAPEAAPDTVRDAARAEREVRRHELAAFLRSRRERITPEQVGLPRGTRRRTPGLRREEVAHLSSVGVTWYTWLEQARDIQVSPQVLDALARALLLDSTERAHLFALAGSADPAPGGPCPTVTPELRELLTQLEPLPACVQNSRYDILAYNRTYGRLLRDMDALDREDRNCVLLTFTDPAWRASVVNLDETMHTMAAKLRASMAEHLAEPAWKALLARLQAIPEFAEIWERHEVLGQGLRTKRFRNPDVGELRLTVTNLWLGPSAGPRLMTFAPADEESRAGLDRLLALAVAGPSAP